MSDLYQVDVRHFCAGVIVRDNEVVQAAPILRWAVGKLFVDLTTWVKRKGGTITKCPPKARP